MAPHTTAVEKRVYELRAEINRLFPIRQAAFENLSKIMKRRATAINKFNIFMGNPRPSTHVRSVRARVKMSKKIYSAVMKKTKWHFAENYAKHKCLLKMDMFDTFKQIVMVKRYIDALQSKIDTLWEEQVGELNSEAWNQMIYDKRLLIDQAQGRSGRSQAHSPVRQAGRGRPAAPKAKGRASGRGSSGSAGRAGQSPATPQDGEHTPLPVAPGQLKNWHQLEPASFKGPWAVHCGHMKAEATVSRDGRFDMHQMYIKGQTAAGWSALRCGIEPNHDLKTFVANIDGCIWTMTDANMELAKSVIKWKSEGKPESVWTRTKRPTPDQTTAAQAQAQAQGQGRPKAKAKSQPQRSGSNPTTPLLTGPADAGRNPTTPGSPQASVPTEWYTEVINGRLMWTDGISAVPAEERVTDANRQKTKMQF
jgi:hypothetical protein